MNENILNLVPLFDAEKTCGSYEIYIYGSEDKNIQAQDTFGQALTRYFKETGLSSRQFALVSGIRRDTLKGYCKSDTMNHCDHLAAICIALRLHPRRQSHLFELSSCQLHRSDPRYYIIQSHLDGCAFIRAYTVESCELQLCEKGLKLFRSRKEVKQ